MIVQRQVFTLDQYTTVSGCTLHSLQMGFETYGTLNVEQDNVILICHYFSGNAHAAGRYHESDAAPGWWDSAIGPGKVFDTDRYFLISSDSLVNLAAPDGLTVTTGPATINPATGKRYGMDFPIVSVTDIVRVQKKLLEHLGIDRLVAVAGPSGGAAQAVEWSVEYPECVERAIGVVPLGLDIHPYASAMIECWTRPILLDPLWKNGDYPADQPPRHGLAEALHLTLLTALSYHALGTQFGPGPADPDNPPGQALANPFKADAMLDAAVKARVDFVDPNHFIYMVRAYKLFDVKSRLHRSRAKYLMLPVESDLIFPPHFAEVAVEQLHAAGREAELFILKGQGGHLDGLTQMEQAREIVQAFLATP